MRVLIHQAKQNTAHEAFGCVPLERPESQEHGNCRYQLNQQGEYLKSILLHKTENERHNSGSCHKDTDGCHKALIQKNLFEFVSIRSVLIHHVSFLLSVQIILS